MEKHPLPAAMTQLKSAKVLITGAGGGFGQALTRQLLAKGSHLILSDVRTPALKDHRITPDPSAGSKSVAPPPQTGKILACIEADLATQEGCEALYTAVQQLGIVPDVVINNAGLALFGAMTDIPSDRWEQMLQVNLLSPMRLSTRFAADMVGRREGHIVNISSLAGWIAPPGLSAYAASKFGLRGFSEGLRDELAPHNVRVTVVYPFFSRTPLLQSPRFGVLAKTNRDLPPWLTTDPSQIMARTIRAIERNQEEVFPDRFALSGQWLKRYCPPITSWISRRSHRTLT